MEVNELRLGRFRREVVAEEPLVAEMVLLAKEGIHLRPGQGLCKGDTVVDIHAQHGFWGHAEASEEGGGIQGGEDGGEWGPLRSANGLVAKGAHLAIEGQVYVAISEEEQGPSAQAGGEAKVHENGREAILVYVVEEALDVKHEGSAVQTTVVRNVNIVVEGEAGVQRAGEGVSTKLRGGDEAMCVDVVQEALGHSLLKEFAEAFQEGNGVVVLSGGVVVAPGFGDDND